jgi:hypothetical protein
VPAENISASSGWAWIWRILFGIRTGFQDSVDGWPVAEGILLAMDAERPVLEFASPQTKEVRRAKDERTRVVRFRFLGSTLKILATD